jgi:hypothetical protein
MPPARGDRGTRDHRRNLKLHQAHKRGLVGQNIWQPFTVANGFFNQLSGSSAARSAQLEGRSAR